MVFNKKEERGEGQGLVEPCLPCQGSLDPITALFTVAGYYRVVSRDRAGAIEAGVREHGMPQLLYIQSIVLLLFDDQLPSPFSTWCPSCCQ